MMKQQPEDKRNAFPTKKVLINLPTVVLAQIDEVAASEFRTRSDLVREALRRYVEGFRVRGAIESAIAERMTRPREISAADVIAEMDANIDQCKGSL